MKKKVFAALLIPFLAFAVSGCVPLLLMTVGGVGVRLHGLKSKGLKPRPAKPKPPDL